MKTKRCSKCKIEKLEQHFYKNISNSCGLSSWCKECKQEWSVKYTKTPHSKLTRRAYYLKNKIELTEKETQRRNKDPRIPMLLGARQRAKNKNLPFNIKLDDIIIPEYCPLLNIKLFKTKGHSTDNSPTLDRILPELGYIKGNIWVISYRANAIKRDALPEEILLLSKNLLFKIKEYKVIMREYDPKTGIEINHLIGINDKDK